MTEFRRTAAPTATRHDALVAVALGFAGAVLGALVSQVQPMDVPAWAHVLASFVLAAPLAWRRRAPVVVMVVVSLLYGVAVELGAMELNVSQVVLFLAFYSVGAWVSDRRLALRSRAVLVAAMAIWLATAAVRGFLEPETGGYGVQAYFAVLALQVALNAAYFGAAWVFGDRAWAQALERQALIDAQAELRAQQERLTEQAIGLERLRIARELHDVVAHHVSAMGIQAGAARRVLQRDPDRAADALRSVEDSARSAIGELGTMVGALRSSDDDGGPMPTLADLPDLVRQARHDGPVEIEVVGDARPLGPSVELTAYRVVQEALTNVRKHAGAGARADVRLRYREDDLEVEIGDDGTGGRSRAPGLGVGQTGMRERVTAVGGTIEMGPKTRGGYLVRAALPTTTPTAAPPAAVAPTPEERTP